MNNNKTQPTDTLRFIFESDTPSLKDIIKMALSILLVLALGFVALNQGLGFVYKVHFLKAPCDLCAELNPGVQECIDFLNQARPSFYINASAWSDPFTEDKIKINITLP